MPFQSGISGNPTGRPKASGSRQQIFNALVEPHREILFQKAIDMALNGNEAMLRLFLERMLPAKPREEPIALKFPEDISEPTSLLPMSFEVFKALERQEITTDQFKTLLAAFKEHRENIIAQVLHRQISELEIVDGRKPTVKTFLPPRTSNAKV